MFFPLEQQNELSCSTFFFEFYCLKELKKSFEIEWSWIAASSSLARIDIMMKIKFRCSEVKEKKMWKWERKMRKNSFGRYTSMRLGIIYVNVRYIEYPAVISFPWKSCSVAETGGWDAHEHDVFMCGPLYCYARKHENCRRGATAWG